MSSSYQGYSNYTPGGPGGPYAPVVPQGSTDPLIARLRPRDVAGLVDQAFRLYRRHFLTFLAIIAVVHVPLQLLIQLSSVMLIGSSTGGLYGGVFNPYSPENANEFVASQGILLVVTVALYGLYAVLLSFSQGALTAAVADSYLDRPVSFGGAYRQVAKHIGPLFGLMVLQALIVIGVFIPAFLSLFLGIGLSAAGNNAGGAILGFSCLAFLLMLVGVVVYAFVDVRLRAAVPALMVENLGPTEALRRSWRLLEGYWWRTLGIILLLAVISWVVASGPAALVSLAVAAVLPLDLVMRQAVTGVVTVITTAIFIPIQLVALTLYYFDIKVRREGFDIETALSRQFPGGTGQAQPVYGNYTQPTMPPPTLGYGPSMQAQSNQYSPYGGATTPPGASDTPPTGSFSSSPGMMPGEAPTASPETPQPPTEYSPGEPYMGSAPSHPEWNLRLPGEEDTARGENEG